MACVYLRSIFAAMMGLVLPRYAFVIVVWGVGLLFGCVHVGGGLLGMWSCGAIFWAIIGTWVL